MNRSAFRHLRAQDYRRMPWKNGGGTTTELIIEPSGATLDGAFSWRLSMAEVGVSGPFSRFEGCDRTLLLLGGGGMRLAFAQGGTANLEDPLEPVGFSGDLDTTGTLLAGPCRDFNVITRRSRCHHRVEVLTLDRHPRPLLRSGIRFIFCVEGSVQAGDFELAPQELLRVEGMTEVLAWAPQGGTAIVVGIDPAAGIGASVIP